LAPLSAGPLSLGAGNHDPVERSAVFFESRAEAAKEGKKALAHLLAKKAA